ncbi:MAG: ABC transporter ATP-binding protein [Alphaproteobacteria bacterium]|nr:ABC transporter ATP-binding protein [Alphaproteobacteria bacterium]
MNKKNSTLTLKNISKTFIQGNEQLHVLKNVNLEIKSKEIVALLGPSGSGKSTLLQIAGLLDDPSNGEIYLNGTICSGAGDKLRTELRRDYLGFVYQYHNLLPDFDALENVILPQLISGVKYKEAADKAKWLLHRLGLDERENHRPAELSGGEQQRVAIARALANTPKLLLADEPTGNLDPNTSENVFSILMEVVRETGLSALIATHNIDLAHRMDREVQLKDGKLVDARASKFISNGENFY